MYRVDARNLHTIRIFDLKVWFLRRVNDFFDRQKKAILTNSFRSFPSPSPSSPLHRFLYISGNVYQFKGCDTLRPLSHHFLRKSPRSHDFLFRVDTRVLHAISML